MASLKSNRFTKKAAEREEALTHEGPGADTDMFAIDVSAKVVYEQGRAQSVEVFGQTLRFEDDGTVQLNERRYQLVVDGEREELQPLG